jgi:PPOX class probable FMN-dependent enzyme
MDAPFPNVLTTEEELRERYREPHRAVKAKIVPALEASAREFIGLSPFVLVSTADEAGNCDVSPRGGPPGFVKVLDDNRLVIPDLNGNNLLDTISNVLRGGHAGLLFIVPGKDETLRVNGRAWVTVDDEILDGFSELRRPTCAIGVEVAQVYIHCAKAFRRGRVWQPAAWEELAAAPSAARMLTCQIGLDTPVEELERQLEVGYAAGLEADRPVPA